MAMARLTALGVLLLVASSCFSRESIPNQRALDPAPAYVKSLEDATRQREYFENLDIHVHIFATQLSPAFQKAYHDEYRAVYGVSPVGVRNLDSQQLQFVVAMTANNGELTKLSAFDRLWTVSYDAGTTEAVRATRIESFDRDALFLRYFFPYWNPWRRVYLFEFPVPVTATNGTLALQGPAGDIRLNW